MCVGDCKRMEFMTIKNEMSWLSIIIDHDDGMDEIEGEDVVQLMIMIWMIEWLRGTREYGELYMEKNSVIIIDWLWNKKGMDQ